MRPVRSDRVLSAAAGWIALWYGAGAAHWLAGLGGTHSLDLASSLAPGHDVFGRNLLSVILGGSLTSSGFALGVTAASACIGTVLGSAVAVGPKPLHGLLRELLNAFLAFPPLLFALGWAALEGPGWSTLAFALMIGAVPSLTRLIFARSREILNKEYVLASRSIGAGPGRVLWRHVLPSSLSLCLIKAPNLFAHALVAEATLSFLGIGAPLGRDTWGSLLLQGRNYLIEAPDIAAAAGLPLVLTVLSLQVISERLSRHFGEKWL